MWNKKKKKKKGGIAFPTASKGGAMFTTRLDCEAERGCGRRKSRQKAGHRDSKEVGEALSYQRLLHFSITFTSFVPHFTDTCFLNIHNFI